MDQIKKFQDETLERYSELQDLNLKQDIIISFLKNNNLTTKHLNSYFSSVSQIIAKLSNSNYELAETLKQHIKK